MYNFIFIEWIFIFTGAYSCSIACVYMVVPSRIKASMRDGAVKLHRMLGGEEPIKEMEYIEYPLFMQATNQYSSQSRKYHPYAPCHPPNPVVWQMMLTPWGKITKRPQLLIKMTEALGEYNPEPLYRYAREVNLEPGPDGRNI